METSALFVQCFKLGDGTFNAKVAGLHKYSEAATKDFNNWRKIVAHYYLNKDSSKTDPEELRMSFLFYETSRAT